MKLLYLILRNLAIGIGILCTSFLLLRIAPGDPAVSLLKSSSDPNSLNTALELARIRQRLGLNKELFYWKIESTRVEGFESEIYFPILIWNGFDNQFHNWIVGLARLDWGTSYKDGRAVTQLLVSHWTNTIVLSIGTLAIGFIGGWYIGLFVAALSNRTVTTILKQALLIGYSAPTFLIAGLLISLTSALGLSSWINVSGSSLINFNEKLSFIDQILNYLAHIILPILCGAIPIICFIARLVARQAELEYGEPHVQTARSIGLYAKELTKRWIRPLLRIPVRSVFPGIAAATLGGSVVLETIFNIPGIGRLAFHAALERNYPVLMGVVITTCFAVQLTYLMSYASTRPKENFSGR